MSYIYNMYIMCFDVRFLVKTAMTYQKMYKVSSGGRVDIILSLTLLGV